MRWVSSSPSKGIHPAKLKSRNFWPCRSRLAINFDVTFTDDPGKTLTLSYADVKFVDVVKSYLAEQKKGSPSGL